VGGHALFRQLRLAGTPIPTNDIWVAALVVQHGLALCARDAHFDRLPQLVRACRQEVKSGRFDAPRRGRLSSCARPCAGARTMPTPLLIAPRDLLHLRGVESERVEFKARWSETGPRSPAEQILHSICAFANDLHELNGGYVVVGVDAADGVAQLPPRGLAPSSVEEIQKRIRVLCRTKLEPEYQPRCSPATVDGREVLVIWAPASDNRPHRAARRLDQEGRAGAFWVRLGAETVEARGELERELLALTAKIPFDDRRAPDHDVSEIRASLVREFLRDTGSDLAREADDLEVFRQLGLCRRANSHELPRNVALLFFTEDPGRAFPGARVEVVELPDGPAGDRIDEVTLRGPLPKQIRDCVDHVRRHGLRHIRKTADRPEAATWERYPLAAVEEAVVNAVYHRSYEGTPEPTKVEILPDRLEITSYPGPVPSLRPEDLQPGRRPPPVPARNRRIGEFLKALRLAEQHRTGIPRIYRAMELNGSPPPRFDFDEARTWFRVTLPAAPG